MVELWLGEEEARGCSMGPACRAEFARADEADGAQDGRAVDPHVAALCRSSAERWQEEEQKLS